MLHFNQEINTENVRRESLNGDDYVVAPINLLKPMYLNVPESWGVNEAYVPEQEAKESLPSWNGTPLTLNHPATANGAGTTANQPEMHEKAVLGRVFNAGWDDGMARAEAWFNEAKIREMGGMAENALERVLNGDAVEVSTGYRASKLPPGEYDGESHNAVQGNLKPDHVAVLPNSEGKCSVDAGCGVGDPVTANELIVTNADLSQTGESVENQLSEARTPDYDGTETQSWADVSKDLSDWVDALGYDDVESVADLSDEQRQEVAGHTLLGDPDADSWESLRFFPVVNPNTGDLNRGALMAVLSGRGAQADIPDSALDSARGVAEDLLNSEYDEDMSENTAWEAVYNALKSVFHDEPAESGTGNDDGTNGGTSPSSAGADDDNSTTMSEKTQELVDNHGFKADNLPDEDTECFEAIYNRFVEGEEAQNDTTDDKIVFENKDEFEAAVEEVVSNRQAQSEKEQLASEIASNSAEYDDTDAVLEDFPTTPALNAKRKDVVGGADFSAARGADAQPATNTADDVDDFTMFEGDV